MKTKINFEVEGLEEYLKQIQKMGKDIDDAVEKAIMKSAEPVYEDAKAWAEKHKRTGASLEGMEMTKPEREGNFIFTEIGTNSKKSKGAWHIVFVEYGTPWYKPDPGMSRAFNKNKKKIKQIQRDVLKREGMPLE